MDTLLTNHNHPNDHRDNQPNDHQDNHQDNTGDLKRPWLPGPPPPRQLNNVNVKSISPLVRYQRYGEIPIRRINLHRSLEQGIRSLLQAYPPVVSSPGSDYSFLFHGCGAPVTDVHIQSFQSLGPEISFSRPRSYFSAGPAVYWTNSLIFALQWSYFTRTSRWVSPDGLSAANFECILYVSRVDMSEIPKKHNAHAVPNPTNGGEEQRLIQASLYGARIFPELTLSQWCESNMTKNSTSSPPPGTNLANWDLVSARIPEVSDLGLLAISDV